MMSEAQKKLLIKNGFNINNNLIYDTKNILPYAVPYFCIKDQSFKIKLNPLYLSFRDLTPFLEQLINLFNLIKRLNTLK